MPTTFSDFNSAAQLREIIRSYAVEVIDEVRPPNRYAIVTAIHATLRQATVRYPDEVATFTIPYGSAQPTVGATVRVAGRQGARYVEDVLETGTSDIENVPAGQKIYHRINGKDILTIENPADIASAGWVMRVHPTFTGYMALMRGGMSGSEYALISSGTETIVSASATGSSFLRAGANDSAHQVAVSPSGVAVAGVLSTNSNITAAGSIAVTRPEGFYLNGITDANHRVVSVNQLANMPWSDGPVLCGNTGWAYLDVPSGAYRMGFRGTADRATLYFWTANAALIGSAPNDAAVTHTLRVQGTAHFTGSISTGTSAVGSFGGNVGAAGLTTIGGWSSDGAYCAIMGHYGYHLMGKGGIDGAVHTRGNNPGWDHYIGAGNLIRMEQWTVMALGAGSGGALVQKADGVIANAGSQRALKERIEPLTDTIDAGAIIDALEPITFIWKASTDSYSQSLALAGEHRKTIVNDLHPDVLALAVSSEAVPIPDAIAAEVVMAAETTRSVEGVAARPMAAGMVQGTAADEVAVLAGATESAVTEEAVSEEEAAALLEEVAARISEVPSFDLEAAEAWRQADIRIGLVAEDVAEVLPQLANWVLERDEDGNQTGELVPGSWNDQGMITMLVQAVKDLRARVAALEVSA